MNNDDVVSVNEELCYSIILSFGLREHDGDYFVKNYDAVLPKSLSATQIESIKEEARRLTDLPEVEFSELAVRYSTQINELQRRATDKMSRGDDLYLKNSKYDEAHVVPSDSESDSSPNSPLGDGVRSGGGGNDVTSFTATGGTDAFKRRKFHDRGNVGSNIADQTENYGAKGDFASFSPPLAARSAAAAAAAAAPIQGEIIPVRIGSSHSDPDDGSFFSSDRHDESHPVMSHSSDEDSGLDNVQAVNTFGSPQMASSDDDDEFRREFSMQNSPKFAPMTLDVTCGSNQPYKPQVASFSSSPTSRGYKVLPTDEETSCDDYCDGPTDASPETEIARGEDSTQYSAANNALGRCGSGNSNFPNSYCSNTSNFSHFADDAILRTGGSTETYGTFVNETFSSANQAEKPQLAFQVEVERRSEGNRNTGCPEDQINFRLFDRNNAPKLNDGEKECESSTGSGSSSTTLAGYGSNCNETDMWNSLTPGATSNSNGFVQSRADRRDNHSQIISSCPAATTSATPAADSSFDNRLSSSSSSSQFLNHGDDRRASSVPDQFSSNSTFSSDERRPHNFYSTRASSISSSPLTANVGCSTNLSPPSEVAATPLLGPPHSGPCCEKCHHDNHSGGSDSKPHTGPCCDKCHHTEKEDRLRISVRSKAAADGPSKNSGKFEGFSSSSNSKQQSKATADSLSSKLEANKAHKYKVDDNVLASLPSSAGYRKYGSTGSTEHTCSSGSSDDHSLNEGEGAIGVTHSDTFGLNDTLEDALDHPRGLVESEPNFSNNPFVKIDVPSSPTAAASRNRNKHNVRGEEDDEEEEDSDNESVSSSSHKESSTTSCGQGASPGSPIELRELIHSSATAAATVVNSSIRDELRQESERKRAACEKRIRDSDDSSDSQSEDRQPLLGPASQGSTLRKRTPASATSTSRNTLSGAGLATTVRRSEERLLFAESRNQASRISLEEGGGGPTVRGSTGDKDKSSPISCGKITEDPIKPSARPGQTVPEVVTQEAGTTRHPRGLAPNSMAALGLPGNVYSRFPGIPYLTPSVASVMASAAASVTSSTSDNSKFEKLRARREKKKDNKKAKNTKLAEDVEDYKGDLSLDELVNLIEPATTIPSHSHHSSSTGAAGGGAAGAGRSKKTKSISINAASTSTTTAVASSVGATGGRKSTGGANKRTISSTVSNGNISDEHSGTGTSQDSDTPRGGGAGEEEDISSRRRRHSARNVPSNIDPPEKPTSEDKILNRQQHQVLSTPPSDHSRLPGAGAAAVKSADAPPATNILSSTFADGDVFTGEVGTRKSSSTDAPAPATNRGAAVSGSAEAGFQQVRGKKKRPQTRSAINMPHQNHLYSATGGLDQQQQQQHSFFASTHEYHYYRGNGANSSYGNQHLSASGAGGGGGGNGFSHRHNGGYQNHHYKKLDSLSPPLAPGMAAAGCYDDAGHEYASLLHRGAGGGSNDARRNSTGQLNGITSPPLGSCSAGGTSVAAATTESITSGGEDPNGLSDGEASWLSDSHSVGRSTSAASSAKSQDIFLESRIDFPSMYAAGAGAGDGPQRPVVHKSNKPSYAATVSKSGTPCGSAAATNLGPVAVVEGPVQVVNLPPSLPLQTPTTVGGSSSSTCSSLKSAATSSSSLKSSSIGGGSSNSSRGTTSVKSVEPGLTWIGAEDINPLEEFAQKLSPSDDKYRLTSSNQFTDSFEKRSQREAPKIDISANFSISSKHSPNGASRSAKVPPPPHAPNSLPSCSSSSSTCQDEAQESTGISSTPLTVNATSSSAKKSNDNRPLNVSSKPKEFPAWAANNSVCGDHLRKNPNSYPSLQDSYGKGRTRPAQATTTPSVTGATIPLNFPPQTDAKLAPSPQESRQLSTTIKDNNSLDTVSPCTTRTAGRTADPTGDDRTSRTVDRTARTTDGNEKALEQSVGNFLQICTNELPTSMLSEGDRSETQIRSTKSNVAHKAHDELVPSRESTQDAARRNSVAGSTTRRGFEAISKTSSTTSLSSSNATAESSLSQSQREGQGRGVVFMSSSGVDGDNPSDELGLEFGFGDIIDQVSSSSNIKKETVLAAICNAIVNDVSFDAGKEAAYKPGEGAGDAARTEFSHQDIDGFDIGHILGRTPSDMKNELIRKVPKYAVKESFGSQRQERKSAVNQLPTCNKSAVDYSGDKRVVENSTGESLVSSSSSSTASSRPSTGSTAPTNTEPSDNGSPVASKDQLQQHQQPQAQPEPDSSFRLQMPPHSLKHYDECIDYLSRTWKQFCTSLYETGQPDEYAWYR